MTEMLHAGGRLATTTHSADEAVLAARGIRTTNVDVFGTTGRLDEVARFMDAGGVTVPLAHTFPLAATADALAAIQAGHLAVHPSLEVKHVGSEISVVSAI